MGKKIVNSFKDILSRVGENWIEAMKSRKPCRLRCGCRPPVCSPSHRSRWLHTFQQSGLSPGRGPVDFIRQQDIGEHRPFLPFKLFRFPAVNMHTLSLIHICCFSVISAIIRSGFTPAALPAGPETTAGPVRGAVKSLNLF